MGKFNETYNHILAHHRAIVLLSNETSIGINTLALFVVLCILGEGGVALRLHDLMDATGTSYNTARKHILRLQEKAFVIRATGERKIADKHQHYWMLTSQGVSLNNQYKDKYREALKEIKIKRLSLKS